MKLVQYNQKTKEFTESEINVKPISWADVTIGQEVYILAKDHDMNTICHGPHTVVSKNPQKLQNKRGIKFFSHDELVVEI